MSFKETYPPLLSSICWVRVYRVWIFKGTPDPLSLSQRERVARRADMKTMREYVSWLYYQYLLITGIYVLEPWEKSIFNTVLFTMVAMVIYTSYVFVPIHVRLALEFFSGLVRGHPESTVALMSWEWWTRIFWSIALKSSFFYSGTNTPDVKWRQKSLEGFLHQQCQYMISSVIGALLHILTSYLSPICPNANAIQFSFVILSLPITNCCILQSVFVCL